MFNVVEPESSSSALASSDPIMAGINGMALTEEMRSVADIEFGAVVNTVKVLAAARFSAA